MIEEILRALGYGFLQLWLNPVFYLTFLVAFILGVNRVKKERNHFYIRIYDVIDDLYHAFVPGLLAGLVLSVLFVSIGIVLSQGVMWMITAASIFLMCLFQPRLLSPAYILFLTAVGVVFLPDWLSRFEWLSGVFSDLHVKWLPNLLILGVVFLFVEAMFIIIQAKKLASPRRMHGKRGKPIGAFETNRIWLIPAFLPIPGTIVDRIDWWPIFAADESAFTFMLFPFLLGYRQYQTYDLPKNALKRDGMHVAILAAILLPLAILTYVFEWYATSFIIIALMFVLRYGLYIYERKQSTLKQEYFTLRNDGLQILAIVPKTPAAEMNLKVGEIIKRVNDIDVRNATEFYEALKKNSTFVKLEVIDEEGEIRFEQRAFYERDHHLLGLLFVDEPRIHYSYREAKI